MMVANNAHLELINIMADKLNEVPFSSNFINMDDYIRLSESIEEETAQRYLEDKYGEYNMRIYRNEFPEFEVCKFFISFFANDLWHELIHSCASYRGEIASSEVGKMIELIETKINSKIEVKKVEVKAEDYKPVKCPCCGGNLNSISFCSNDTYIKCEYCDTILTR